MSVKKQYNINDIVWIYGINAGNAKITKGKILAILDLSSVGYLPDIIHYVIEIPSSIEPLLEIRTWDTISQDSTGPVGALRDILSSDTTDSTHKKMTHIGYRYEEESNDPSDPTMDEIHAAMEHAQKSTSHGPLYIKEPNTKRRYFKKKKP